MATGEIMKRILSALLNQQKSTAQIERELRQLEREIIERTAQLVAR
jgi:hypothetical protein